MSSTSFRCIYRDHDAPLGERTLEHVWPGRLGGELCPDFFKTRDVCRRCNSLSGRYVDGEFIRSFFNGVEQISAALAWLDTSQPRPLPCVYMGVNRAQPPDAREVCEAWIGPRGERIFYFRDSDDDHFTGFARGDPLRRRHDPGRVYLSFSRANMFWVATAILSVRKTFPRAEFRLLTSTDSPEISAGCAAENEQSACDRAYIAPLLAERCANVTLSMFVDHGTRFQAKLAIGFGHTLFGPAFARLPYTERLRSYLWERDASQRADIDLRGTPLLGGERAIDEQLLPWPSATTFVFFRDSMSVMSMIYGPSGRALRTVIAADGEAAALGSRVLEIHGNSFVVILVPGRSQCCGPYPLMRYIMHRTGGPPIDELTALTASHRTIAAIERVVAHLEIQQPTGI